MFASALLLLLQDWRPLQDGETFRLEWEFEMEGRADPERADRKILSEQRKLAATLTAGKGKLAFTITDLAWIRANAEYEVELTIRDGGPPEGRREAVSYAPYRLDRRTLRSEDPTEAEYETFRKFAEREADRELERMRKSLSKPMAFEPGRKSRDGPSYPFAHGAPSRLFPSPVDWIYLHDAAGDVAPSAGTSTTVPGPSTSPRTIGSCR